MSYRSVTAGVGLIASGSGGCQGAEAEFGVGGKCCPENTWINVVYLSVKGRLSYRYHCEKRVRHALALLREATAQGSRFEPGVGAVRVDPKLQSAVARASRNFDAIYPLARWYKVTDAVGKDRPCGPYNVWAANPAEESAAYKQSLAQVVGGLPAELRTRGHFALKDPGEGVIYTVPTSGMQSTSKSVPMPSQLTTIKQTSAGPVLAPTPWVKTMLDRLAPLWAGVTLTGDRRRYLAVAPKPPQPVDITQQARRHTVDIDLQDEDESEFPWLVVGAGVAVVGAGAAYWYFRGR